MIPRFAYRFSMRRDNHINSPPRGILNLAILACSRKHLYRHSFIPIRRSLRQIKCIILHLCLANEEGRNGKIFNEYRRDQFRGKWSFSPPFCSRLSGVGVEKIYFRRTRLGDGSSTCARACRQNIPLRAEIDTTWRPVNVDTEK